MQIKALCNYCTGELLSCHQRNDDGLPYRLSTRSKAFSRFRKEHSCKVKTARIMRLTTFLILVACLRVSASSYGQTVSFSGRNVPLEKAFTAIRQQTGYTVFYNYELLKTSKSVTLNVKDLSLPDFLDQLLKDQHLDYLLKKRSIIISRKVTAPSRNDQLNGDKVITAIVPVSGRVVDADGNPLPGVSIREPESKKGTTTDEQGRFTLPGVADGAILEASAIGFTSLTFRFTNGAFHTVPSGQPLPGTNDKSLILRAVPASLLIRLARSTSPLDEIQIIAYGQTSKRMNTGSVATVTEKEIEKQPVANVLSALSGRMPGVFIQTTNGLPGGNINVQIRGKGSIAAGTDPLYIIDGVPFDGTTVNGSTNKMATDNIAGGISPFNSISPSDIASISVLKDADATAIYGSRGANGVVLITTKKGRKGKTRFNMDLQQGISLITGYPEVMNISQYLDMRREAFANDGKIPSSDPLSTDYAPDLLVWDTTQLTDWAKYFLGHTGQSTQVQAGISGGNNYTSFRISGNYRTETTVLTQNGRYSRKGLQVNLQHRSANDKFGLQFSAIFNADNSELPNPSNNPGGYFTLPPHYPLYNPDGTYNWQAGRNPVAQMQAASSTETNNLSGNLVLHYNILPGLLVKATLGYNRMQVDQIQTFPTASLYPGTANYTNFGLTTRNSFITEPQLEYKKSWSVSRLQLLTGASYQSSEALTDFTLANNFSAESLMKNKSSGQITASSTNYNAYKFVSLFGRANYSFKERYILNGTVRRDGSSKFGPDNRFGTFAAIGAAWIFSEESWMGKGNRFLSFGKLRGSYGITGNDKISDYQYLSTYTSRNLYQGITGLQPSRISNYDFHWETTRKTEAAVELGFIQNRVLISTGYYFNRSKDQLVNYPLAAITGFSSYQANLPAVVENSGWELEANTVNVRTKDFTWTSSFNITFPKNRLRSFENFGTSSYRNYLQLGYDITRIYRYLFLGVDPATGDALYAGEDGKPSSSPYFYATLGKQTPDYYGGFNNSFTYKRMQLDIFAQFARQTLWGGIVYTPGLINYNQYIAVMDRWRSPGDIAEFPKSSNSPNTRIGSSSANVFDVPYLCIKNVSFSYQLPEHLLSRKTPVQIRVYAQGQNLLTFWNKQAAILDPESGGMSNNAGKNNVPPVRSFVLGLQLNI